MAELTSTSVIKFFYDQALDMDCAPALNAYTKALTGKPGLPGRYLSQGIALEKLSRYKRPATMDTDPSIIGWMRATGNLSFYIMPMDDVNGDVHGWLLRSDKGKDFFADYVAPVPFAGWWAFKGFRKGQPIFILEGYKDALAAQHFWPYSLSMLTNRISVNAMGVLARLTKHLVIVRDNDDAGHNMGAEARELGVQISTITPPVKDVGMLFEKDDARRAVESFMQSAVNLYCR